MTPQEFSLCLDLIGWSKRGLANRLGVQDSAVRHWASGKYEIPPHVAKWLVRLSSVHTVHPLPEGWRETTPAIAEPPGRYICSICLRPHVGYGNNAWPINDKRCCDICNTTVVIPARIAGLINRHDPRASKTETKEETP